MGKTLDELKAENAQAEDETIEDTATEIVEPEVDAGEVETEEVEQPAEVEQQETEETELEDWQLSDEQASEKQFTGGDIAAAKRKLRSKLEKQHSSEVEQLKAEIEALKNQRPVEPVTPSAVPTLEQFEYDNEKYQKAMNAYVANTVQAQQQQLEQQQQQLQQQARFNESVDKHYERAAQLAQQAGIAPDVYQASDLAVRQSIEAVVPGKGEVVTDQLISRMGEGSEKVMYYLGRNAEARSRLQSLLMEDPSGLTAGIYLGELKASKATAQSKRVSQAPKPAKQIQGDESVGGVDKFYKQYSKLSDSADNLQKKLELKYKARQAGVDTSNW